MEVPVRPPASVPIVTQLLLARLSTVLRGRSTSFVSKNDQERWTRSHAIVDLQKPVRRRPVVVRPLVYLGCHSVCHPPRGLKFGLRRREFPGGRYNIATFV